MVVLLAIAGWGAFALAAGLIAGEPFLRTGGALVLCVSVGGAFVTDWLVSRREVEVEAERDWDWPEKRRAA